MPEPNETAQATAVVAAITEKPGDIIGRYKLLQKIGEGGCGVVYMAEQEEPVRRRVALKVIKLGMDTRSVIARFEAERQALALMDHPNIAKVLDAGATQTGRPFFVMELVRGIKITNYCDENKLSTGERLKLFTQVCHAIQHAHQKGIIHRDIKPSNILVTVNDGAPIPKVIDFGIAKATTDQRLTDKTLFTAFEQFIGTPAYMSPEQAAMTSLDIDTRSDIYALGVLLYELFTGTTPFDAEELLRSGLDGMRRTIREQEPLRPSTRLSTMLAADQTAVASRRQSEPAKLSHQLRGDLDWIAMKALEKDRTRRYETANAMAMDIERHLHNEPVLARPPSNLYRFQKLVRRNKVAFVAGSAIAAALVIGLAASTALFIRERQARKRADEAERVQAALREQAEAGRALEAKMRVQAELGKKYAEAGFMLSLEQFDNAEKLINELPPHPASASIYNVLGNVRGRRGQWQAAISNYTQVMQLMPSNHLAYHFLAPLFAQTGDIEGYRSHCDRIRKQFAGTSDPTTAERMAKDCLIFPPPAGSVSDIAKMVDTAVAAGPGHKSWDYFQFVKGLAEYRAGHFADAIEWSQKVADQKGDPGRTAQAEAVLAMAQHQLKQTEAARASLAKAAEVAQTKLPAAGSGNFGESWNDWIIAHVLLREAQALIDGGPK